MKKSNLTSSVSSFLSSNNVRLKKKSVYSQKVTKYISQLKVILNKKQNYNKLSLLPEIVQLNKTNSTVGAQKKKSLMVLYSICFSFSSVNTFLYIVDALGSLKVRYSAGLLNFKGKSKKSRFQILKVFFKELRKLKRSFLKNKPVALHLENVGSYKHLIIKNLKKMFFVRIIHNSQTHSYNGCRKKKKLRK